MLYMFAITILSAAMIAFALRRAHRAHLDEIDASFRASAHTPAARDDLPAAVVALAARLGACAGNRARVAVFNQTGAMWQAPNTKPSVFSARQTAALDAPGFLWRASFQPLGVTQVADYLVGGTGGLEVRLFGAIRLVAIIGGSTIALGETLRYLAEIPWNPDAILRNRALEWTVIDDTTIAVAVSMDTNRAEVTFTLDAAGLIVAARASARPYVVNGVTTNRPWHGRFWDYQQTGGRLIPRQGEVAWVLDAGDFVYWRGQIVDWETQPD